MLPWFIDIATLKPYINWLDLLQFVTQSEAFLALTSLAAARPQNGCFHCDAPPFSGYHIYRLPLLKQSLAPLVFPRQNHKSDWSICVLFTDHCMQVVAQGLIALQPPLDPFANGVDLINIGKELWLFRIEMTRFGFFEQ